MNAYRVRGEVSMVPYGNDADVKVGRVVETVTGGGWHVDGFGTGSPVDTLWGARKVFAVRFDVSRDGGTPDEARSVVDRAVQAEALAPNPKAWAVETLRSAGAAARAVEDAAGRAAAGAAAAAGGVATRAALGIAGLVLLVGVLGLAALWIVGTRAPAVLRAVPRAGVG